MCFFWQAQYFVSPIVNSRKSESSLVIATHRVLTPYLQATLNFDDKDLTGPHVKKEILQLSRSSNVKFTSLASFINSVVIMMISKYLHLKSNVTDLSDQRCNRDPLPRILSNSSEIPSQSHIRILDQAMERNYHHNEASHAGRSSKRIKTDSIDNQKREIEGVYHHRKSVVVGEKEQEEEDDNYHHSSSSRNKSFEQFHQSGSASGSTSQHHLIETPRSQVERNSEFNIIASKFNINSSDLQNLLQIFQESIPETRQFAITCMLISKFQDLERLIIPNHTGVTLNLGKGSNWKGADPVRSLIREKLRKFLLESETQAYSTNETVDHNPINGSLEHRMIDSLHSESKEFQESNLPPGFQTFKVDAELSVMKVIKEIAKAERCKFQSRILSQIKNPTQDQPVPDLRSLVALIIRSNSRSERRSNDEIWNDTPSDDKMRYAHLRLEGAIFHIGDAKDVTLIKSKIERERSMWDPVDDRLAWIRSLNETERNIFEKLIIHLDQLIFNGSRTFDTIKRQHTIHLPSPIEFQTSLNDHHFDYLNSVQTDLS
ncbi:uncharacterized protein MELLADRAFT_113846 [Melampsora larici-populina 98AG31]|uniref:Uncharacterized protein n=1 Tax=Melampsora larici-populina (strain 98AG31 / pathotype 3-4-7) TaxID=747676 RepID=F4SB83_MELLP|nr:uncharacterized protein MELLADRAFT_113846 [Melampsora larici-populina 98AG31]EGF98111.1 hypothetical protein MELLADRAFT_113846 [Melampsora larici-populina 98AG31]